MCTIILVTLCNFGIVAWTQLKVSGHFLKFSYTVACEEETNMVVKSWMTCKIGLIWCHRKTLYKASLKNTSTQGKKKKKKKGQKKSNNVVLPRYGWVRNSFLGQFTFFLNIQKYNIWCTFHPIPQKLTNLKGKIKKEKNKVGFPDLHFINCIFDYGWSFFLAISYSI